MKLSICFLTFERSARALVTLKHNLQGLDPDTYDLFICDQGSHDPEFQEKLRSFNPKYLRINRYNEGISRAFNQLIMRTDPKTEVVLMGNDILLQEGWDKHLRKHLTVFPNAGIIGFDGMEPKLDKVFENGLYICKGMGNTIEQIEATQIFGNICLTRRFLNICGAFDERYHPYGLEDQDINFRARLAGLDCFYMLGVFAQHAGAERASGDYKAFKSYSFDANVGYHRYKVENYYRLGVYVPWPALRESLT